MRIVSPAASPRKGGIAPPFASGDIEHQSGPAPAATRLVQRRGCMIVALLAFALLTALLTTPVEYTRVDRLRATIGRYAKAPVDEPIPSRLVMVTMDEANWHAAFNWLVFANRSLPLGSRLLVATHSASLARDLTQRGVPSLYEPLLTGKSEEIWSWRLRLIGRLISTSQVSVLNLDSDAVLLRDLWPEIDSHGHGSDLVVSRGWASSPSARRKRRTQAVNLGTAYFANTPASERFLQTAERLVRTTAKGDDFATINELLGEHLRGINDERGWAHLNDGSLSVALLPVDLVQHTETPRLDQDPAVVHVRLSAIDLPNSWDKLSSVGLWCLRDGWEQVWADFGEQRRSVTLDSWRELATAFTRPDCFVRCHA